MTTLTGPLVPQVVTEALDLYRAVLGGRWSAAVDVTQDLFADPDSARRELDLLAVDPVELAPWPAPVVDGDTVTFDGDDATLRSAVDLYMRVLLGQFSEVSWATGNGALTDACSLVRATYQRKDGWPDHPRASWSIAGSSAPRIAVVAYDIWKLLDGGIKGRPLLTTSVRLVREPVPFEVFQEGVYLHGTKAQLAEGELLVAGRESNFEADRVMNHVYFTATLDAAVWGAELAAGDGPGRIYVVEPTGDFEDDPNVTNKRFPGNPTQSFRSREPLRVVRELRPWIGHSPQRQQEMRDGLAALQRAGAAQIED